MAFFSDPSKAGLAFMIVGLLQIIGGIITIVLGVTQEETNTTYGVIVGVGSIICGALVFGYGNKVKKGIISAKIEILAQFVRIVGVITIIGGVFSAIASVAGGMDLVESIVSIVISIILGLIIIFIAGKINDGKQTTADKIIWIILLIVFAIEIILALVEIISIVGILTGICDLIIYVFMLLLLLDPEVKSQMNM